MYALQYKLNVGDEAYYISDKGKILNNKIESIKIEIGSSTYRTDSWLGIAKTGVETHILYKLENTPAGYYLTENSVFASKEELLGNI